MHDLIDIAKHLLDSSPHFTANFTAFVRILFPILSLLLLSGAILSLFTLPRQKELFARFLSEDGSCTYPLHHLECLLGRSRSADISLSGPGVSRIHAVVSRSGEDSWKVYDMDSKEGTFVNDREVNGSAPLSYGDVLRLGETSLVFQSVTPEEQAAVLKRRRRVYTKEI